MWKLSRRLLRASSDLKSTCCEKILDLSKLFWGANVYLQKSGPLNKLAEARKTGKSPDTLGLKKFGMGKLWVKKFGPKVFSLIFSLNWIIL